MAFTTYGTGMGTVAQGDAYVPNWGQEMQSMVQMGQTISNYYAQKHQMAVEDYQMLQQVTPENEADAAGYSEEAKKTLQTIENYKTNNPNWRTDPMKYSKVATMARGLQTNQWTENAKTFKAQQDFFNKYAAEKPGFLKTKEGALMAEQMNYRAKYGKDAYMQMYGQSDFQFSPPEPFDYPGYFKSLANRYIKVRSNVVKQNGLYYVHNLTDDSEINKGIQEAMQNYPDQMKEFAEKYNIGADPNDRKSLFETIKQHVLGTVEFVDEKKDPKQIMPQYGAAQEAYYLSMIKDKEEAAKSPWQQALEHNNLLNNQHIAAAVEGDPIENEVHQIIARQYTGSRYAFHNPNTGQITTISPSIIKHYNGKIIIPDGATGSIINQTRDSKGNLTLGDMVWKSRIQIDEKDFKGTARKSVQTGLFRSGTNEAAVEQGKELFEKRVKDLSNELGVELTISTDAAGNRIAVSPYLDALSTNVNLNTIGPRYNESAYSQAEKWQKSNETVGGGTVNETTTEETPANSASESNGTSYSNQTVTLSFAKAGMVVSSDDLKKDNFVKEGTGPDGKTYTYKAIKKFNGEWIIKKYLKD